MAIKGPVTRVRSASPTVSAAIDAPAIRQISATVQPAAPGISASVGDEAAGDGLLTTLPTWEDEQAAYTLRGIADTEAQLDVEGMGWSAQQRSNFEGFAGASDIHNDTEGDDFWLAFWQPKRLTGSRPVAAVTWGKRLTSVTPFFREDYDVECQQATEQNFDHIYAWGLCDHITENPGDTTSINTLNAVMAILIDWNATTFVKNPGDLAVGDAGNGSRRFSRLLRLVVRAQEVSPSTAHKTFRDKVIDIALQDSEYVEADGYSIWAKDSSYTDDPSHWGPAGTYASGMRIMNTFHMGIMFDALWHAWRVLFAESDSRAETVRDRLIGMAKFYRDIPLNENGLLELFCGYNIDTQTFAFAPSGQEGSPQGSYTVPPINGLVCAYKFTGTTTYLDRAWELWMALQELESGAANTLHHYADSRSASGTAHVQLAYNKGELQYNYALFENGGAPVLVDAGLIPSWLTAANDKEWINVRLASGQGGRLLNVISGNFGDVTGQFQSYPSSDPVITRWNSAIQLPNHYAIVAEGGHRACSDNGVYVFGPFTSETPQWVRVLTSEFNVVEPDQGVPWYPSGKPASRHGYNHPRYIPDLGGGVGHEWFAMRCGAPFGNATGGNADSQSFQFNADPLTGGAYDVEGHNQDFPGTGIGGEPGACDWDPVDERLYAVGGSGNADSQRLHDFNPFTRTWTAYGVAQAAGSISARGGVIDPVRRMFVVRDAGGTFMVYDLAPENFGDPIAITISGTPENTTGKPGFAYEPVGGVICAWDGGTAIKRLTIPSTYRNGGSDTAQPITQTSGWSWDLVTGITGTMPDAAPNGTFGKFGYIPSIKAFACEAAEDDDMRVFKIPAGGL